MQTNSIQTAEIINRNIPIIYDNSISEINYGEFEGMDLANFNLSSFWNYYNNDKYQSAENIKISLEIVEGLFLND